MNHDGMTMTMATGPTPTGGMGAAMTSSAAMDDHMGMGGCKISMLWNWNTVDSCFISETWKITSAGMFAGSCIGVILLVMCLEFLRRSVKEFDRFLIRRHIAKWENVPDSTIGNGTGSDVGKAQATISEVAPIPPFRPSLIEQAGRAGLHMAQFAVAYFIMLLAMYYNGYLIICIFIGSYLGSFVFQWETLNIAEVRSPTSAAKEATACCG